jgi:alpha-L-rhamnosidase
MNNILSGGVASRSRQIYLTTTALVLSTVLLPTMQSHGSSTGPSAPKHLECENAVNPFIDASEPRLSWKLDDLREGAAQSAFRVLVASSEEKLAADQGDLWDSGKVVSDQSIHVRYAGKPLESRQRVFWKVKTWDQDGAEGAWSEPAFWEMALLDPAKEFSGSWIRLPRERLMAEQEADPATARNPNLGQWLFFWSPIRQHCRKEFELFEATLPGQGRLFIQSDNPVEVFINGIPVLKEGSGGPEIHEIDVGKALQLGRNSIAVRFFLNADRRHIVGSWRAGLVVPRRDGSERKILTDSTWKSIGPNSAQGIQLARAGKWKDADMAGAEPPNSSVAEDGGVPNPQTPSSDSTAAQLSLFDPAGADDLHPRLLRRGAVLRRNFTIDSIDPASARLMVSAKGSFEVRINGKRVGNDLFMPGITDEGLFYQVYDVGDLLKSGGNQIEVLLGRGVSLAGHGYGSFDFGHPSFLADLVWKDAAGNLQSLVTDESWQAGPSPVLEDNIFWGERYDARVEAKMAEDAWWVPAQADGKPEPGELRLYSAEPTRVVATLKPQSITPHEDGWLIDFGRNIAGNCRMNFSNLRPGQAVTARFREGFFENGEIDDDGYKAFPPIYPNEAGFDPAIQLGSDTFISAGGAQEVWEPQFSYTGLRYALIDGLDEKPGEGMFEARNFTVDAEVIGSFESSDPRLNKIWEMGRNTWDSNFIEHGMDCPNREKKPWLFDAGKAFAKPGFYYRDYQRAFRQWFLGGPFMTPLNLGVNWRSGYLDQHLGVPLYHHKMFGDDTLLRDPEVLARMKLLVDDRIKRLNALGFDGIDDKENGDHLGSEYINNRLYRSIWWVWSFGAMAEVCELGGDPGGAAHYRAEYEKWLPRFHERFYSGPDNGYWIPNEGDRILNPSVAARAKWDPSVGAQSAQVLPLALGLVPEDKKNEVIGALVRNLEKNNLEVKTGNKGITWLYDVLADNGQADLAWRLFTSDQKGSFGYMAKHGATAVTESPDATYGPRNHPGLGGGISFLFTHLAGIRPAAPGFKDIRLAPIFPEDLEWVKASYDSPYGLIRSEWKKDGDGSVAWTITVPPNTRAAAEAPTGMTFEGGSFPKAIPAGTHTLKLRKMKE